ncbi:esterase/lipase family protein [Geodermatophilus sp. SYSU D00705]
MGQRRPSACIGPAHLAVLRELAALAAAAVRYPLGFTSATNGAALRLLGAGAEPAAGPLTTPVVLVHGYGGNRSNWLPLELALSRAGFVHVYAMRFNPLTTDVPRLAARLVDDCRGAMRRAGSDRVHVVGHSLGGVVLRCAAARLGLDAALDRGVTIATPHRGTSVARLGRGRVAAELRPGSPLLRAIEHARGSATVRWLSYWSDLDPIVRPWSALLPDSVPGAVNIAVPQEGHLSILRAPALLTDLVRRLRQAEVPTPSPAADRLPRVA